MFEIIKEVRSTVGDIIGVAETSVQLADDSQSLAQSAAGLLDRVRKDPGFDLLGADLRAKIVNYIDDEDMLPLITSVRPELDSARVSLQSFVKNVRGVFKSHGC